MYSEDNCLFWTHRTCEFKQSIYQNKLSKSFYSPSICNGVSKMRALSQRISHILIMNQFSLFPNQTRPSAYFCQCIDIERKLTLFVHTKKNKWYCNWGKLVPIKTIVQLWTRACLDRDPYGMLNNCKPNSVMCKSRLINFNKVLTFIWQIVLFLVCLTNWNRSV